jgi:hydrogenase nickel incorporation protein HypA/HybF
MHELSIAMEIVDQVTDYFQESKLKKVHEVEIDIGEMCGVDKENLEFMLSFAVKGTVIENSFIKFNVIAAKARCLSCNCEFSIGALYDHCPDCNNFAKTIIHGMEFRLNSILAD